MTQITGPILDSAGLPANGKILIRQTARHDTLAGFVTQAWVTIDVRDGEPRINGQIVDVPASPVDQGLEINEQLLQNDGTSASTNLRITVDVPDQASITYGTLVSEHVIEPVALSPYAPPSWWYTAANATDATVSALVLDGASSTARAIGGSTALTVSDDLDALEPGARSVWAGSTASALGLPTVIEGLVQTFRYGNIDHQMWYPATTVPQQWLRTKRLGGWTEWTRVDAGAVPLPGSAEYPTPPEASGTKRVPLILSAAASSGTTTTTSAGTLRFPIRYAATVQRFRLHVSNRVERANALKPGAVSLTGIWFGPAVAPTVDAAFAGGPPTQIHGAVSLPSDGSEWTSPWLPASILKDTNYLLSVGFTTAGQASVLSTGGAYQHAASTEGGTQSTAGFTRVASVPLSWWIEAEVPAAVPVVAGFGDSNTIGVGTTLPVFDSWLSQHCRTVGALPLHQAYPGAAMSEYEYATWLWSRWDDYARADAAVFAIGINDLQTGITLAEMQDRTNNMVPQILEHVAPVLHFATITPSATKAAAVNTVRQQFNDWLKTLPHDARDVFDFAAAVDDGTGAAMDPLYDHSDTLHLVTAGHTALAGSIVRAPILPAWS